MSVLIKGYTGKKKFICSIELIFLLWSHGHFIDLIKIIFSFGHAIPHIKEKQCIKNCVEFKFELLYCSEYGSIYIQGPDKI